MNNMRGGAQGFTIVETLFFLAFSGALLFSALALIGGQNRKTHFNATARELESKIQSVVGNVSSGYYNSNGNGVSCTISGGAVTVITPNVGLQGQNPNCVFVGQMFLAKPDSLEIYSIIGPRLEGTKEKDDLDGSLLFRQTVDTYKLPDSYSVGWIRYGTTTPPDTINSFAIVTTFAAYNPSNDLVSGSSNVNIYAKFGNSADDIDTVLQPPAGGWRTDLNAAVNICITDGSRHAITSLRAGTTRTTIQNGGCPA